VENTFRACLENCKLQSQTLCLQEYNHAFSFNFNEWGFDVVNAKKSSNRPKDIDDIQNLTESNI